MDQEFVLEITMWFWTLLPTQGLRREGYDIIVDKNVSFTQVALGD